jgi:hypothetical protein
VEHLRQMSMQIKIDTEEFERNGGVPQVIPMGMTALDPSTGQTMKAARVFYASSKRGSNANKRATAETSFSRS